MKTLIFLEYFTSQSIIDLDSDKEIFREALNISDSIIKSFINNNQIKKIHVVRNQNLNKIKSEKINYHFTNKNKSYLDIIEKFKIDSEIILIAPETQKLSIKFYRSVMKKFKILSSSLECLYIFSSKIKTFQRLKYFGLPTVEILDKKKLQDKPLVSKPEYGAGSSNVYLNNYKSNFRNKYSVIQEFYEGIKGSFLMICKNGKSKILCCNKQIIEIHENKIKQIGCIIGGLEKYRKEIEKLGEQISSKFKGLFGVIGVDIVRFENQWLIIEINSRFTSSFCALENAYDAITVNDIVDLYIHKKLNNAKPIFIKEYEYLF